MESTTVSFLNQLLRSVSVAPIGRFCAVPFRLWYFDVHLFHCQSRAIFLNGFTPMASIQYSDHFTPPPPLAVCRRNVKTDFESCHVPQMWRMNAWHFLLNFGKTCNSKVKCESAIFGRRSFCCHSPNQFKQKSNKVFPFRKNSLTTFILDIIFEGTRHSHAFEFASLLRLYSGAIVELNKL